ncbi:uracil-DNA glycosylase [Mesotoga sp. Brook.08.YT.4.2.5.1]|uniref:uracil-DNA glycosylase n=1 Tax=unclassified Mesotoga TaxID=1184398 RepID=UPI000C19C258|nr:uracil-DNA glycosylase [Mesotoga sp. Brook.08.YT.4.2.5.1]PNS41261.1 uracil-DNA glycosylase [Mesotoga sp. B105.6.4]RAM58696.1 uracil-DNA glycosylase [Mesotoga sp. SC_4PWL113PWK15]RAM60444.1 uracil-DNA glycosylase [Mesotoga sp. SC_4PWA21]RDI93498.1 uracil-DNA glycosylase [Mesotoga sp. Brook.08.YT.4.2.5.2.]
MTDYVKRKELLLELNSSISDCSLCPLSSSRTNTVPGEGSIETPVVFVGEGPGADEDASGRPFVGKAGELLTKILDSVKLSRQDVFITNIVKCRPPKNRVPSAEEQRACSPYLLSQLAIIKPKLIVALGATALSYFVERDGLQITKVRGQLFDWIGGIKVFVMFHPSYLLRNASRAPGSPKSLTWEDIQKVRKMYDQLLAGEEIDI